jgi:hypothetical protein
MQIYDYVHRSGVEAITWKRFAELARELVEKLAPYNIDAVVGTARGPVSSNGGLPHAAPRVLSCAGQPPCER